MKSEVMKSEVASRESLVGSASQHSVLVEQRLSTSKVPSHLAGGLNGGPPERIWVLWEATWWAASVSRKRGAPLTADGGVVYVLHYDDAEKAFREDVIWRRGELWDKDEESLIEFSAGDAPPPPVPVRREVIPAPSSSENGVSSGGISGAKKGKTKSRRAGGGTTPSAGLPDILWVFWKDIGWYKANVKNMKKKSASGENVFKLTYVSDGSVEDVMWDGRVLHDRDGGEIQFTLERPSDGVVVFEEPEVDHSGNEIEGLDVKEDRMEEVDDSTSELDAGEKEDPCDQDFEGPVVGAVAILNENGVVEESDTEKDERKKKRKQELSPRNNPSKRPRSTSTSPGKHLAPRSEEEASAGTADSKTRMYTEKNHKKLRHRATTALKRALAGTDAVTDRISRMSEELEGLTYHALSSNEASYKDRMRTLCFNLKKDKNPELVCSLMNGDISLRDVSQMASGDLASREEREKRQARERIQLSRLVIDNPEAVGIVKVEGDSTAIRDVAGTEGDLNADGDGQEDGDEQEEGGFDDSTPAVDHERCQNLMEQDAIDEKCENPQLSPCDGAKDDVANHVKLAPQPQVGEDKSKSEHHSEPSHSPQDSGKDLAAAELHDDNSVGEKHGKASESRRGLVEAENHDLKDQSNIRTAAKSVEMLPEHSADAVREPSASKSDIPPPKSSGLRGSTAESERKRRQTSVWRGSISCPDLLPFRATGYLLDGPEECCSRLPTAPEIIGRASLRELNGFLAAMARSSSRTRTLMYINPVSNQNNCALSPLSISY
uniref:TFIIS central domain-containing protein n=1 Tax=Compsopogon caeruleus TaxID=31354 RepID=A0A6T6C262_9RHOD